MPDFSLENTTERRTEEADVSSVSSYETAAEPQQRKKRSKEQVKDYQTKHYEQTKEYRLLYRQSLRGQHKVPNNRCYLHTTYLPRYIREPKKKPKANLDWMNYGGKARTLTITQPTDELISFIRSHIELPWEETFDGVMEVDIDETVQDAKGKKKVTKKTLKLACDTSSPHSEQSQSSALSQCL